MSISARRLQRIGANNIQSIRPSDGLFFDQSSLTNPNNRLVFGHFFGPYPLTILNTTPDYYENDYLPVNGESGIHATYGGFLRDRPLASAPYAAGANGWRRTMQNQELTNAVKYGLDGFFFDLMSTNTSGDHWLRYVALADEAAANFSGFKVTPMIDGTASIASAATTDVAIAINTFLSKSCAWQLSDSSYPVGTFAMEAKVASWWQEIADLVLNNHGKIIRWIGVYVSMSQAANYSGTQWMSGPWGQGADPGVYASYTDYASASRGRGEKVLTAVWPQDARPRSSVFDEALNSASLRAAWNRVVADQADIVQLCTWSDFSEGSTFVPSAKHGSAMLEISAWYAAIWKSGSMPTILQDTVYLIHRNQTLSATITGGQSSFMAKRTGGSRSALRNDVEVLSFLTAPADILLRTGGTNYTFTAPAGMSSTTYAVEAGEQSVKVMRGTTEIARVNSGVVVKTASVNEDREYCWGSSLSGTSTQYDPTPGSPTPNITNYIL